MTLDDALAACPILAILRGVRPTEVLDHVAALAQAGVLAVEIPLNSPDPTESIGLVAGQFGQTMVVGAGTVLTAVQVEAVARAGGRLIVSPNTDPAVINRTLALKLESAPGFATPSEAFLALRAGARRLKLFPAATYGAGYARQLKAVLPGEASVWAVGGVGANDLVDWWAAGVRGFGIGSEIYRAGQSPAETGAKAAALVEVSRALTG